MKLLILRGLLTFAAIMPAVAHAQTVFYYDLLRRIAPTIEAGDPSALIEMVDAGSGVRSVFDRRANGMVTIFANLFEARYQGGHTIELVVNPEFGVAGGRDRAGVWASRAGQVPEGLRDGVDRIVIHDGDVDYAGGMKVVTIHEGRTAQTQQDMLEELFMHEATHAAFQDLQRSIHWRVAQAADTLFLTTHAAQHPESEDVAATFPGWVAARLRPDRLPPSILERIVTGVPNRLAVFDRMGLATYPLAAATAIVAEPESIRWQLSAVFPNPADVAASVQVGLVMPTAVKVSVVDLLGRVLAVWFEGDLEPGEHVIRGSVNMPPGVYFVALDAGGSRDVRSFTVVR